MPLQPYRGTGRKLLLGIDIGTTFSGVSYCVLDPGEVPQVLSVTRFPGQEGENKLRDTKIPTVVYYGQDGRIRAIGAEARTDSAQVEALDENWVLAEWFKLHLRPADMADDQARLPTLPRNKSVVDILADFMSYIYKCARDFISEADPKGQQILRSNKNIEFVLTHPNGWGGGQQSKMRRAAVQAGLIPETAAGQSRIHFVTEGEASLHYCVTNGLAGDAIKIGNRLMIVDAGGGTVDLSTYKVTGVTPVSVVECAAADCLLQGSTFVNVRAKDFLKKKLKKSRFGNEEDLSNIIDCFEASTKPTFRDAAKPSYTRIGGPRDTDEKNGIKRGVLSLSGSEMASFFRPSVNAVERAMQKQVHEAGAPINIILLVGGFSASPFLRSELQAYTRRTAMRLFSPEGQPAKAVAEGALFCYLDRAVTSRVARYTYGSICDNVYVPTDPEYMKREQWSYVDLAGNTRVPGGFVGLLPKGTSVSNDEEFKMDFIQYDAGPFTDILMSVSCYKGELANPQWVDEDRNRFSTLCTVRADTSRVPKTPRYGPEGLYYSQDFKLVLLFGLTELKAQLSWIENGRDTRSPATIVYDDETD